MKRTKQQVIKLYESLGLSEYINGVTIEIQDEILYGVQKCDGIYYNKFGANKAPAIFVRPLKNRDTFEFVCLHELGHHIHHTFMPNCTKGWDKQTRESFANRFAAGEYKRFINN